jgi:hypothetical protein
MASKKGLIMLIYATTKNSGPSWHSDPIRLVYLGTSLDDARNAVGEFQQYECPASYWYVKYPETYSAIPASIERELVTFCMADGWWYTVVKFNLGETH